MKTWNYKITIFTNEGTIIIKNPIACKGTITRSLLSSSNSAEIELYNLSLSTRNKIYQDPYMMAEESKRIRIEVGYSNDGSISQVFYGRILQAYSTKQTGSTEVVTKISALCVDLFNESSITFDAGTSKRDAIKSLVTDLPDVSLNALGGISGEFTTPTTFDGNTLEQIQKITDGTAFIDNNNINVCLLNEVIDTPIPIISNDNVLLETPIRKGMQLEINFLMQPYLQIGQLLEIRSKIYPNFNGQYKVAGFTHTFLISESIPGQKTTKATLLIGGGLPVSNISTTDGTRETSFNKVKKEQIVSVNNDNAVSINEVYKYIKKTNGGIPPNSKITSSIAWADMIGQDNKPNERVQELSISRLTNCFVIATNLQRIIDKYYPGKKISVTSGWRSVQNNRDWGGKSNSKHLSGLAIDFHIDGVLTKTLEQLMRKTWSGGIGYVYSNVPKNFVHIQVDNTSKLINDV